MGAIRPFFTVRIFILNRNKVIKESMSKLTDRVDNQNIINLARQNFENKQRSKLPTVIVNLASQGKIYPETHPLSTGKLEMRYMTAYDEDVLTNASYIREGVVFDKLLETIIVTDINVADISPVDKDGLLIQARILAYGTEYPVTVADPKTKNILNRVVALDKLKNKPFDLVSDKNGEFEYQVNDATLIKFTWVKDDSDSDKISDTLKLAIREVNGDRKSTAIEEFIRYEFMSIDAKKFRKYMLDNMPGLDMTFEFESEDGSTFKASFRVGTDLFWF
jgi:hypothetical protein